MPSESGAGHFLNSLAILKIRLLAAGLRYLGAGTQGGGPQSWNSGFWQLGFGFKAQVPGAATSHSGIQASDSWP